MKRRRSKAAASLPRVTVLAFNRRQLADFALAVENLGRLVDQLTDLAARFEAKAPRRKAAQPATAERNGAE